MYKIVEIEPSQFVVYRKFWFFWISFKRSTYADEETIVFNNKFDAELALLGYAQERLRKKKKPKFKKQVYIYREDGRPPDRWLPTPPPL